MSRLCPQALIEWTRSAADPPTDAFEVKRHGHMDTQCRLAFHFDHAPEKFQLPPPLAAALGMQVCIVDFELGF